VVNLAERSSGASRVLPAEAPTVAQLLNVVLAAVIVGALYLGREFLVPMTLAVLLAFVLAPVVRVLRRARLPHAPAVLITVALTLALLGGAGALIGSQLAALGHDLPKYQGTIQAKIEEVGGLTTGRLAEITGRLGLQAAQAGHQAAKAAGLAPTAAKPAEAPTLVQVYRPPLTPLDVAKQVLRPLLTPLAKIGLVFVLTIFMLLQQADLRDRLIRLMGARDLHRTTVAMNDAAARLSRYYLSQLAVNVAFGGAIAGGLALIGVPHAVLWGAVAAILRFIPYVGTLISVSLAACMAAAVDPGWTMVAWTVGLFLLADAVTGQFIEPLLYGHSTGLSPVSVVVAAVFWTWLWGPPGLILSTPLSLCLLVMGRHVPRMAFIEVLLGDRPPLTLVESFYQRVLAGDTDDVLQQAQANVAEVGLAAYYDDVALQGLLLAAGDAQRGILKRDQLARFKTIVEGLISDLSDAAEPTAEGAIHAARKPSARAPVLICVAGPGLLDDLGAAMLCQLASKHGLRSVPVPYRGGASPPIEGQEVGAGDLICVVHLAVGRNQARALKLLQGLQKVTSSPLLIANVRGEGAADWVDHPRVQATANLREALQACAERLALEGLRGPEAPPSSGQEPSGRRARKPN
jgi:predicted PurR-regulated permease PerM